MAGSNRPAGRINRRSKGAGPLPYDFRRPTKLSREHIRTLQIAYETFARQFTTVLTTSLRAVSQVTLLSIEQFTYDEYIASLESPTVVAKVSMEPLPGTAIVEFSLDIAMTSIDHMLGGSGGPQPQRPLTDIETPLLQGLFGRVLGELRYALEGIASVRPELIGIEYNPQFVQAGGASDPVIVASFEMKVGASEGVATVCMPLGMIFPKLQGDRTDVQLSAAQRAAREAAHRNLVAGMESVPLDVSVRFQPVRMRPEELINLRLGDVVTLNHPSTQPLAVTTAGMTFAHAVPGSHGTRLACLIVAPAKEEDR
ncbi:flagellar motor switch protein FliM [Planosporangium flavigriseum]|uniref:Flagellar motor switch protein FliM n=2 Tax=Planosporangium flavigriseum TaxID=373681 RepID=A0A8J3PLU8_9ACTN|nr:flagellar motor switch protein FliM [Planosporangium flavigriseum]NJC66372.1 flagellar motor switch protein FliM [Planosporangium flavigriseum]GIG74222.1 flagellar motor switch protein FliM [Planosporangium flavigriseum]